MPPRSGRLYAPEELEHFAKYRDQRADFRPRECRSNDRCWVTQGPPAIGSNGACIGCRGKPLGFRQHISGKWSDVRPKD
jgi:hypothetical protein